MEKSSTMGNHLCHFELMTPDPAKAREFYGGVFDWQFDDKSMPGYTLINTGREPSGGIFPAPEGSSVPCANIYIHVDSIDDTLTKAKDCGAKVIVPKTEIPSVGHFAMFADPQGIAIGIMQPAHA